VSPLCDLYVNHKIQISMLEKVWDEERCVFPSGKKELYYCKKFPFI
jgi:hypothetical protein